MKIQTDSGENLSFGKAFGRMIVKTACFFFAIIGAVAYAIPIMVREDRKSLADLAIGSYVSK